MIYAKSRLWPDSRQDEILRGLEAYINRVRAGEPLEAERVIRALSSLGDRIAAGKFDRKIAELASGDAALRYKSMAVRRLSRDDIEERLRREMRRCGR